LIEMRLGEAIISEAAPLVKAKAAEMMNDE